MAIRMNPRDTIYHLRDIDLSLPLTLEKHREGE